MHKYETVEPLSYRRGHHGLTMTKRLVLLYQQAKPYFFRLAGLPSLPHRCCSCCHLLLCPPHRCTPARWHQTTRPSCSYRNQLQPRLACQHAAPDGSLHPHTDSSQRAILPPYTGGAMMGLDLEGLARKFLYAMQLWNGIRRPCELIAPIPSDELSPLSAYPAIMIGGSDFDLSLPLAMPAIDSLTESFRLRLGGCHSLAMSNLDELFILWSLGIPGATCSTASAGFWITASSAASMRRQATLPSSCSALGEGTRRWFVGKSHSTGAARV